MTCDTKHNSLSLACQPLPLLGQPRPGEDSAGFRMFVVDHEFGLRNGHLGLDVSLMSCWSLFQGSTDVHTSRPSARQALLGEYGQRQFADKFS